MNIKKILVASIAALSMVASSVVALAAGDAPVVTATAVESETGIGLKLTFDGITTSADTLAFKVELPATLKMNWTEYGDSYIMTDMVEYDGLSQMKTNMTSSSVGAGPAAKNPFKTATWNVAKAVEENTYYIACSMASGKEFTNSDWVQLNFLAYTTYADLKAVDANAFKLTEVQVRPTGDAAAMTQAKGQVTVVDPTTAGPTVVEATVSTDPTFVDAYQGDSDGTPLANSNAVAYKAGITPGTETVSNATWTVTVGANHQDLTQNFGTALTGDGEVLVGLIVNGLSEAANSVALTLGE